MRKPAPLLVSLVLLLSTVLVANEQKDPAATQESDAASDHVFSFVEKEDQLVISLNQRPAANFVFRDPRILRPYFSSVHAPNGLQVTRTHPPREGIDAVDHNTMHPGIWLAFGDISGNDFWRNEAKIEHLRFTERPMTKNEVLTFATESQLIGSDNTVLCRLTSQFILKSRPAGWILVWDSTFHAEQRDFAFGDQEEMGFGGRLATPLTEKNGGRILNSNGLRSAKTTWGQLAKWCDYSGKANDVSGGITLMAATFNFRPSWWHNRDYGVFVANPYGQAAMKQGEKSTVIVQKGDSHRATFGAFVHNGVDIEAAVEFAEFEKLITP